MDEKTATRGLLLTTMAMTREGREGGKQVVRSEGWFNSLRGIMDGLGGNVQVEMRNEYKRRKAIKRLKSMASVWAMAHPSKHPASDKQDNYFYQYATTCQRKIYGRHVGRS